MSDVQESVSASEAAREMNVSSRQFRRLAAAGKVASFRTPSGYVRVRRKDLDAYIQSLSSSSALAVPSRLDSIREEVQALNLELQQRRARRDLKKFEEQEREEAGREEAKRRAQEDEARRVERERQRQEQLERHERQQAAEARRNAQERRVWENGWIRSVMSRLPYDCPPDVQRKIVTAVRADLERVYGDPAHVVGITLHATVEGIFRPWLRIKEAEEAASSARLELSALVWGSDWERRAREEALVEISALPNSANYWDVRSAARAAGRRIRAEYERKESETRSLKDRERAQQQRAQEVDRYLFSVLPYLQKCVTDFEGEAPYACAERCKQAIRPKLMEDPSLSFFNADERIKELVDSWIDAQTEHDLVEEGQEYEEEEGEEEEKEDTI